MPARAGAEEARYYGSVAVARETDEALREGTVGVPEGFEDAAVVVFDRLRVFGAFATEEGRSGARAILNELGFTPPIEIESPYTHLGEFPNHSMMLADTVELCGELRQLARGRAAIINVNFSINISDLMRAMLAQRFARQFDGPIERLAIRVHEGRVYLFV